MQPDWVTFLTTGDYKGDEREPQISGAGLAPLTDLSQLFKSYYLTLHRVLPVRCVGHFHVFQILF